MTLRLQNSSAAVLHERSEYFFLAVLTSRRCLFEFVELTTSTGHLYCAVETIQLLRLPVDVLSLRSSFGYLLGWVQLTIPGWRGSDAIFEVAEAELALVALKRK